jgi:iron complex transport system permease protein
LSGKGNQLHLIILSVVLVVAAIGSLAAGPVALDPATVVAALTGAGDDPIARAIVVEIRLPRTLLAVIIGATLGISGAALQGLLRNPLASPSLFGAPSAAAFGAVLAISAGLTDALSFALPLAAIGGAFVSVFLLMAIAGPRANLLVLILAGLAVSSFAAAATALALNLAPNPFAALEIAFWLLGSLEDRSFRHVAIVAPFAAVAWALLLYDRRALRALTLGEEAAASLGVDLLRTRARIVTGVALGVGACVAVSGTIGFVGLVAPHLLRPWTGYDPARLPIPAAIAGACLLLVADTAVRLIPITGGEIKVGVLTALIGVPFFLLLIFRERRLAGDVGQ